MPPRDILISRVETAAMGFEETVHPEGFWMARHAHEHAHMAVVLEGSIENHCGRRASVAESSSLLFVPAGEDHATRYRDRVHALYIQFRPAWWGSVEPNLAGFGGLSEFRNGPPAWLGIRIYREFQKKDRLTPLMLEGLVLELLVTMSRDETVGSDSPGWLRRVEESLRERFLEGVSLEELATEAGVHPGHLMRAFRQKFHCTVGDYVRKLRVERACAMLSDRDTAQSLGEIALDLGFADQSCFCRTFKRATGMSPNQFRKSDSHVIFDQTAFL